MSDRIAVMHAGKVEQLGTPEELYERPTTRFVADFIGSTNLLRGTDRGRRQASACRSGEIAPGRRTTAWPPATRDRDQRPPGVDHARPGRTRRGARSGRRSSRPPISGPPSPTTSARPAGSTLTVLSPKTGPRLPVGSDVAVTLVTVRGARPRRRPGPARGGAIVNDKQDPRQVDLERELDRYMARAPHDPPELLEQIAKVGAFAALAPIIAACAGRGAASASASASAAAAEQRPRAHRRPRRPRRRPSRRRSRRPRASCSSTTGTATSARTRRRTSRTSTGSRSSTTSSPMPRPRSPRSGATARAAATT